MHLYSSTILQNIFVKRQSKEAFDSGYIDKETFENIKGAHPSDLYSPNIFVAIGLGILTLVMVLATAVLVALLFDASFNHSAYFIFLGIASYSCLEFICKKKKHKNSGVDIVLMACVCIFISIGLSMSLTTSQADLWQSFVLTLILLWFAYRFINAIAALAGTIALLIFTFNLYSSLGDFSIFTFPYLLILASGILYIISRWRTKCYSYFIYYPIFKAIKIVSLVGFYLSGNYFVVEEIIKQNYLLNSESALSASWFFWFWTFAVPVFYLVIGIIRKDLLLIRFGVLLIAGAVLTFKYYYQMISVEVAMIAAGGILVPLGYFLMRLFRVAKYGYLYNPDAESQLKYEDANASILSQVLPPQHVPEQGKFGGGSFGGAGAGANY